LSNALFELESINKLPLWAQVLIASRMARRAVLAVPSAATPTRKVLLHACDAMDRCAAAGEWLSAERPAIRKGSSHQPAADAHGAKTAVYYAADATHAAHDSLDFSAAENACEGSVWKAIDAAATAKGVQRVQAMIFLAADLDTVRFACKEARVGRYDRLGSGVMGRMVPVASVNDGC